MQSQQIAIRLPQQLLRDLDELVADGLYESRAAAVRAGVESLTALQHRQRIDEAIVDGYRRSPPTIGEDNAAMASLREAIAEEPW